MLSFNFALTAEDYTIKNALTWGFCKGHYQKAFQEPSWNGRRCIQLTAAFIQAWPIISQITSLFELMLFTLLVSPSAPRTGDASRVEDSPAAVISNFKRQAAELADELKGNFGKVRNYFPESPVLFKAIQDAFQVYSKTGEIDVAVATPGVVYSVKQVFEKEIIADAGFVRKALEKLRTTGTYEERPFDLIGERALTLADQILQFHLAS